MPDTFAVVVDDDRPGRRHLVVVPAASVPLPPNDWEELPAFAAAIAWERHAGNGNGTSSLGHVFRVTQPGGRVTRWVHERAGWLKLGCLDERPGCNVEETHTHQRGGGLVCPWCGHELGNCLDYGCGEAAAL